MEYTIQIPKCARNAPGYFRSEKILKAYIYETIKRIMQLEISCIFLEYSERIKNPTHIGIRFGE